MTSCFAFKAIVLAITFVIIWGSIGLIIGGPADVAGYALILGPLFAIAGILGMAHDLGLGGDSSTSEGQDTSEPR